MLPRLRFLDGKPVEGEPRRSPVRNIGLQNGRIAIITIDAVRGRDTIDARGLVVAPGFIDLHAHGQTAETYRFQALDGVTTALELERNIANMQEQCRAWASHCGRM